MQWFKHDADATQDAKMRKLLMHYGVTGYAIYFHCLELIAGNISDSNITFELEHDSEIIADDLYITGTKEQSGKEIVEEVMRYMIELQLFEINESSNRVVCMKMLKRLDASMTSNASFRKLISEAKQNHDAVMTNPDVVMQDKTRLDKIRIDKNKEKDNTALARKAKPTATFGQLEVEEILKKECELRGITWDYGKERKNLIALGKLKNDNGALVKIAKRFIELTRVSSGFLSGKPPTASMLRACLTTVEALMPAAPKNDTLPRSDHDYICPKCGGQVQKGDIGCAQCGLLVMELGGVA